MFGCAFFPYLKPYNKHKLDFKISKCLFLGYGPFHKGYRCLHPSGRIYIARSVSFDESSFPNQSLFVSTVSNSIKTHGAPAYVLPAAKSPALLPASSSFDIVPFPLSSGQNHESATSKYTPNSDTMFEKNFEEKMFEKMLKRKETWRGSFSRELHLL